MGTMNSSDSLEDSMSIEENLGLFELSSLNLSNGAEDLGDYPTLRSVMCPDANYGKRSCAAPVHSEVYRSETPTVRLGDYNHNNSEFAAVSIPVDIKQSSSSDITDSKNALSGHSSGSKAPLPNEFNKKLYLPKVHELPASSGAQALSSFSHHKGEMIESLHNLHSSLKNRPTDDSLTEQPSGLSIKLFDYQLKGLSWLFWRESESPPGGIVADDMGLGKTIQMISLILKSKEKSKSVENNLFRPLISNQVIVAGAHQGGTLIIVPSSVLGQWNSEINKCVKPRHLTVGMYHGQSRMKSIRTLAMYSIVLSTYGVVQKASDQDPLKRIRWERIILDEAHLIRNHTSQTAKCVFTLKGIRKWALTGTPIQNKCRDYYVLMKFLQLKPFNDLAVWKKFVDNKHDSGFSRLGVISKAIMLRRTKEQVKNASVIPGIGEKYLENVVIGFDEEEFVLYEKLSHFSKALLAQFIQEQARREVRNRSESNGTKYEPVVDNPDIARWRENFESMGEIKTLQILVLLLRLRQLCCHPSLARPTLLNFDFETDTIHGGCRGGVVGHEATPNEIPENVFGHDGVLDTDCPLFEESRLSSKIKAVLDLVRRIFEHSKTDKVIIVSQWTSFLSLIEKFISDFLSLKCSSFNGKIPVSKRQPIVDEFNSTSVTRWILLLSLTAGGIGLNLVGANHIIFTDLHWNPQLENQAADRIYRFGQTKNVYVYKILCTCTIEERILRLQQKKIGIANGVLNGSAVGEMANQLSINDLKLLFDVGEQHDVRKNFKTVSNGQNRYR